MTLLRTSLLGLALGTAALPANAADQVFNLTIRDHRFEPERLEVPAGQKIELKVTNLDASAEEFESHDLKREKVVAGGKTISVPIGPLQSGTYEFFGEYNPKTARGQIVAK